jgi:hypothetical protein
MTEKEAEAGVGDEGQWKYTGAGGGEAGAGESAVVATSTRSEEMKRMKRWRVPIKMVVSMDFGAGKGH